MGAPSLAAAASLVRSRWKVAVAALVGLVLPLASWASDGRGRLAFTMYAASVDYRLEVAWLDGHGLRRPFDPADIAKDVSSSAALFLVGSDAYRTVAQIDALRVHLRDIGRAACRSGGGSVIEITLYERPLPLASGTGEVDSATTQTSERIPCPRSE
jgi:hypothetical protein